MKVIALIGARGGSKGIPHKNITPLAGHPLIAYSIAAAKLSTSVEEVIVTTDSEEIAEVSRRYSATVPFLRPAKLAEDQSLDIEFFRHYFDFLIAGEHGVPDLVVHLRPTTPLRDVRMIDDAVRYMIDHPEADSLRSMSEVEVCAYKLFRLEGEFGVPIATYDGEEEFYNLPRQRFSPAYTGNGIVDVIRPQVLLDTGLLHGKKIKIYPTERTADIDGIADLEYARTLVSDEKYQPLHDLLERIA